MKTFGLEQKVILVTGASGFVGSHLRKALLDEGAYVLAVDVKESSEVVGLNILDESAVNEYADLQNIAGCKIHGLVNNAAISFKGKYIDTCKFDQTISTNIKGTYNMMNGIGSLLTDDASVVNVSSMYGSIVPDFDIYKDTPHEFSNVSYGSSKAAIEYMTKYYAKLHAPKRFNCVAPGGIWNNHSEEFVTKYVERTPLKRMAQVDEIINAILFLLSPLSSYITGTTLTVDGGRTID